MLRNVKVFINGEQVDEHTADMEHPHDGQAEQDRINAGRYEKLKTWLVSKQEGRWIRIGSHYFEKSGSSFDSAVDALDVPERREVNA